MKKTIIAAALLVTATGLSAQPVTGRLTFKQGQVLEVTLQSKTMVSQEAMGQTIDLNLNGSAAHTYKVTNSTADNTTLHHEVNRIAFDFDGMGQKRSVSSDNPKDLEGPMGKPIQDLLKKTFDMVVDTGGTVLLVQPEKLAATEVDDRMKLITSMLKDVMDVVEPPQKGGFSFFKVLPGGDMTKGNTWSVTTDVEGGKSIANYTLSDITDSTIVVNYTEMTNTVVKAEMMGMETTTTMTDKSSGQIILDKTTGIIRRKTINTESEGATEVMGGSMPVKSTSVVVIEVHIKE